MEVPYINWMRNISVYETPSQIYLIGSDALERHFRVLKIDRSPVPLGDDLLWMDKERIGSEATVEAETLVDRIWRLNIIEDPHIYSHSEVARLLHTIQAANRSFQSKAVNDKSDVSNSPKWSRFGSFFSKRRPQDHMSKINENVAVNPNPDISNDLSFNAKDLQQAAASALYTGSSRRSLVLAAKCHGIVGVIRFLRGYYLILITKYSVVAQLGEHQICKVEDTAMIYIPGNDFADESGYLSNNRKSHYSSKSSLNSTDLDVNTCSSEDEQQTGLFHFIKSSMGRKKLSGDEIRYLKLFSSVDLASNFYFSYTYDLSHSLQYNLEPTFLSEQQKCDHLVTLKSIPNDKFVWNWRLIPPKFRPFKSNSVTSVNDQPEWFTLLFHGSVSQIALSACGMPIMITLIARRSRHFAGRRFLKRGVNLVGDVANEVETEQIVHDTSYAFLRHGRVSSYVQMRGSVPLFWSQESSKVVVGRPPLEILRDDPYYESMGLHFASLLKRHGSPLIVLNLMKKREKRKFETTLSSGYERGIIYLSQFLPSRISRPPNSSDSFVMETIDSSPPIIYIGFDIARVQKMKRTVVLNELQPIIDNCVRRTGIYFSSSASLPISDVIFEKHRTVGFNSNQYGIIRVNCVDCLDRTNTAQFVIGRVVLGYQLYGLGFLAEPDFMDNSQIDRLLQELYDEHGDTLALQYGGSQLVHNINTYRKTKKLSSHSRDFVQTLSRYYSNKFSDWEKQCAISVFLRVFRPNLWSGTLYDFIKEHLIPRYYLNESLKSSYQLQDKLATFHSDTDQLLATVAASLSGCIWDMCSDAYLHWLDAWSRLPIHRLPLTDWCPRDLLQCLPRGMDIKQKANDFSEQCLVLPSNDIRVDWFHEFYKLSSYVRLDRFPNSQIRSAELIVEHRTDEHIISSHSSNVPLCNRICSNNTPEKQQTTQFTCPTISAMPMDLGHSICATHSFPSFTDMSNFDWTTRRNSILCKMHHDNSSANETLDHSNKTEVNKTKKWKSGKSQLSINTKKKKPGENGKKLGDDGGDDEDDDEDESSIDSDDEESMENCINIFPPGVDILRISTDSDLSPSKLRRSIDHNGESKGCSTSYSYLMSTSKRQKRKPPIAVGQLTKSKPDSEQIYSNSLSLSQTTTNTSLRNLYEDYLRTDFTKQRERIDKYHEYDLTSPNPLSSISVDKDSLEVYTKYVQMSNIDSSSIPVNSINIYKATAYLSLQLHY